MRRKLVEKLVDLARVIENNQQDTDNELIKETFIEALKLDLLSEKENNLFSTLCEAEGL